MLGIEKGSYVQKLVTIVRFDCRRGVKYIYIYVKYKNMELVMHKMGH